MNDAFIMHIGNGTDNISDDGRHLNVGELLQLMVIVLDYIRELRMTKVLHAHVQFPF